MPATLEPDWMIGAAAPDWLETAMVPPPCWLGVGDGLGEAGVVAAEGAAAAPPPPGRRRRARPRRRRSRRRGRLGGAAEAVAGAGGSAGRRRAAPPGPPPAAAAAEADLRRAARGEGALVAWPSVCTAQLAGASSSSPRAAARTAPRSRPADGDERDRERRAGDEQDGGQPRQLAGEVVQDEQLGRHAGRQRRGREQARRRGGATGTSPTPAPTSAAVKGASCAT